jgi:hypothetical protein
LFYSLRDPVDARMGKRAPTEADREDPYEWGTQLNVVLVQTG